MLLIVLYLSLWTKQDILWDAVSDFLSQENKNLFSYNIYWSYWNYRMETMAV